jgi:NAD(P)-dependent dehydrogenase (short-subunit alcohol dehydrogenase family)
MPKVFLLTGSSRGLGRQIAEAALAAGHRLVATARRPEDLGDLADRYGGQILPSALDVTDPVAARAAVAAGVEAFGHLDVVVNNAGYANLASVEDITLEDFREQIDTNLLGRRERHQGSSPCAAPARRRPRHPGLLDRRAAGYRRAVCLPGG